MNRLPLIPLCGLRLAAGLGPRAGACVRPRKAFPASTAAGQTSRFLGRCRDVGQRLLLLVLCMILLPSNASAMTYAFSTHAEAARISKRIVWAKCTAVREGKNVVGSGVATYWTFETKQVVKGTLPDTFTVRYSIGTFETELGTMTIIDEGAPSVEVGEEVVLFLGRDGYGYPLYGFEFDVLISPSTGDRAVWPPPYGLPLFRNDDGSRYASQQRYFPLEDFLYSLEMAISNDRPPAQADVPGGQ